MKSKLWLSVLATLTALFLALWLASPARGQATILGGANRVLDPASVVNRQGEIAVSGGGQCCAVHGSRRQVAAHDGSRGCLDVRRSSVAGREARRDDHTKREAFLNQAYHSKIGLAFRPGSQVLLREISFNNLSFTYSFTGYLVNP
jgi:hypothetical protein